MPGANLPRALVGALGETFWEPLGLQKKTAPEKTANEQTTNDTCAWIPKLHFLASLGGQAKTA